MAKDRHHGSSLDEFLKGKGLPGRFRASAIQGVQEWNSFFDTPGADIGQCDQPLPQEREAFEKLREELQRAFATPDTAYREVTAEDVIRRGRRRLS